MVNLTKYLKINIIKIIILFRLLNWIQTKVPDIPITNFTTDWNDGKAVGALVDAVAPGITNYKNYSQNMCLKITILHRLFRFVSGLAGLEIE